MNTPNVGAGRLERRVRLVDREIMPGIHGFCSFSPFGAIRGVPLLRLTALPWFTADCRLSDESALRVTGRRSSNHWLGKPRNSASNSSPCPKQSKMRSYESGGWKCFLRGWWAVRQCRGFSWILLFLYIWRKTRSTAFAHYRVC